MIEVRPDELVVTKNPTPQQMLDAVENDLNKSVELVRTSKLEARLAELKAQLEKGPTRAQLQMFRAIATNRPRYNRAFARRKWKQDFARGTFEYRGRLPSCPSFQAFVKTYV
jgi:hypothetical protein